MIFAVVNRLRVVSRSPLARNVGGMMLFTAAGQAIYLLTGPLIGRIFSPAEFGLYGLFYSYVVTAAGVTMLNFDLAIPVAGTDEEARLVTVGAAAILVMMTLAAVILLAVMIAFNLAGFGRLPLIGVAMLAPVLLAQGAVQLSQSWCVRRNDTLVIGKSTIALNVVRGVSQVGVGMLSPFWWALIAGEITGRLANAGYLLSGMIRRTPRRLLAPMRDVVPVLRRYREFATVLLPAQFADSIVSLVQAAGLAYIYGSSALGVFFLMRRTLDMPVAFVFRSLSDVFYARLAQDSRDAPERVRPFFIRSALVLAGSGMAAAIPMMVVSPWLFQTFFGIQWREAGVLAAIMLPASVMNIAVAPVARVFALTERPGLRFAFSFMIATTTFLALGVAWHFELGLRSATIGLSAAAFVSYVTYLAAGYMACSHLRKADDSAETRATT